MITISGNLCDDPELRFTADGTAVARIRLASTDRYLDGGEWKDGATTFIDVNAWRRLGENAAEHLRRGQRVIVTGKLRMRSWEAQDGTKRTGYTIEASDIGTSIKGAAANGSRQRDEDQGGQEEPPF